MRRMLLTALAVAILISSGLVLHRAAAMTLVAPSAPAVTGANLVQMATNVCGNNGCVAVQTKRLEKHQIPKPPHPAS